MIARDLQPISIVDDVDFLTLVMMECGNLRYVVPCRANISCRIDDLYVEQKRIVRGLLGNVKCLRCSTDMWTSRNGDAYLSL